MEVEILQFGMAIVTTLPQVSMKKMTAFVFSYQFHINIASKSADTSAIFLATCLNLIFDRKVTLKCRKTCQKSSLLLCPYITPFIENRFKVALVKK